jgi:hypothetical protein
MAIREVGRAGEGADWTPQDLRQVLSLGLFRAQHDTQLLNETIRRLSVQDMTKVLVAHKVAAHAGVVLRSMDGALDESTKSNQLLVELESIAKTEEHRLNQIRMIKDLVIEAADQLDIRVLLMKGIAVLDWYPESAKRRVGDLDLWLPSHPDAWRLAAALRDLGCKYSDDELPWIKLSTSLGTSYGQIPLYYTDGATYIDIHAGPYSVRHCGQFELTRSGSLPNGSPLSDEDNLCAVVANAAGDWFVDVKTINDIVVATDREVDFDYVCASLDSANLLPFLSNIFRHAYFLCDEPARDSINRLRKHLPSAVRRERLPPLANPSRHAAKRRRRLVVAEHAYRVGRRRSGMHGVRLAVSAYLAYGRPSRVRYERRLGIRRLHRRRLPLLNEWTCVRLKDFPLEEERLAALRLKSKIFQLASGPSLLTTPTSDYIVLDNGDIFLPTVKFVVNHSQIAAATNA